MHYLTTLLCGLGLIGVLLNNSRNRWCFPIWLASNIGFVFIDLCYTGLYERAALHAIYAVLAVHGWRRWGRVDAR